jgi:Flp pilus assembly protein TadB
VASALFNYYNTNKSGGLHPKSSFKQQQQQQQNQQYQQQQHHQQQQQQNQQIEEKEKTKENGDGKKPMRYVFLLGILPMVNIFFCSKSNFA